jgi:hypothetical protein
MKNKIFETKTFYIAEVNIDSIKPHPENEEIFDREAEPDPAMIQSIKEEDMIEMPVLSQDLYIISGHRRIMAAKALGHKTVICKVFKDSHKNLLIKLIHANLLKKPESPASLIKATGILEQYKSLNIQRLIPPVKVSSNGKKTSEETSSEPNSSKLRKQIESLTKERNSLQKELLVKNTQIESLVKELEKMKEGHLPMDQEKVDAYEEKILQLEEENKKLRGKILDLEAEIGRLQNELKQAEKKSNSSSNGNVVFLKKDIAARQFYARRDIVIESLKKINATYFPSSLLDELKEFLIEVNKQLKRIITEMGIEDIEIEDIKNIVKTK